MQIICLVMERVEHPVVPLQDILRQAGFQGEFRVFFNVDHALEYWEEHNKEVDFFAIEDSIVTKDDGLNFAMELDKVGQPVLLLSDFDVEGLARFNRTLAHIDGGRSLLAKIYETYSASA